CDQCATACTDDSDCQDEDLCNGAEICDLTTHRCTPGTPVDCTTTPGCVAESCNPDTGLCDADFDDDGFTCVATGSPDCNDGDPTIYLGAVEVCDGVDNDCNALVDFDDAGMANKDDYRWYPDCDGDGFAETDRIFQYSC